MSVELLIILIKVGMWLGATIILYFLTSATRVPLTPFDISITGALCLYIGYRFGKAENNGIKEK